MADSNVSELTQEDLEKISEVAEEAARRAILSKIPANNISDLTVSVDIDKVEDLNIEVEVELTLSPLCKGIDVKRLVNESTGAAFAAVEKYLRKMGCQFKTSSP
ncbi:MAG: DUF3194 domain-containing protein [Nitrososphaerota archaeon]|nr:DUF3194 domain-containing protein [Candidatus Bathyarchaeota archaeon]MDW8048399.1 DUF3194 domain-containing protein [Nitrososphaerota archaeon]